MEYQGIEKLKDEDGGARNLPEPGTKKNMLSVVSFTRACCYSDERVVNKVDYEGKIGVLVPHSVIPGISLTFTLMKMRQV